MKNAYETQDLMATFEQWGTKHPLHSHPYLDYVFDPQNNDIESIQRFVEVLYVFCETFHDCLFALGASTTDEDVRRVIAENLFDEFGSGKKERGHLALMRRLLYSLGYTDETIKAIRINHGAQSFMDEILRYCEEEHPLKGIGCICIGAECNGSEYFRKIFNAFRAKPCLNGAELHILEIHAGDDVHHRAKMLALIEPYLSTPEGNRMVQEGFLDSIHLFQELWTSMAFYEGIATQPVLKAA
jgi:pyrroloquinoline quinone (PQQ) biosynthesis protein C